MERFISVSFLKPVVPEVGPSWVFQNQLTGCDEELAPRNDVASETW